MELFSPEHDKYKSILQQNPRSKVFAFLADTYRKYTMMDEALDILQKGIRHNPGYVPGHLSLARCYYDQGRYEICYSTLKPLINANRDNLKLQKLFFQVCEELELWEEALDVCKYLQYLDPKNTAWSERIDFLGGKFFPKSKGIVKNQKQTFFCEEQLSNYPHDVDEWKELNFFENEQREVARVDINTQNNIMDIYDKKFGISDSKQDNLASLKKQLQNFYGAINKRAISFLNRQRKKVKS